MEKENSMLEEEPIADTGAERHAIRSNIPDDIMTVTVFGNIPQISLVKSGKHKTRDIESGEPVVIIEFSSSGYRIVEAVGAPNRADEFKLRPWERVQRIGETDERAEAIDVAAQLLRDG